MSDRNHDEDRYDDMKDRAEAAEAERHELKNKLAVQQNWQTLYEREKAEVARLSALLNEDTLLYRERAEVARLREALTPFRDPFAFGEPRWGEVREDIEIDCCVSITYGDVLRLRAALGEDT
jgi:hypothetical protein